MDKIKKNTKKLFLIQIQTHKHTNEHSVESVDKNMKKGNIEIITQKPANLLSVLYEPTKVKRTFQNRPFVLTSKKEGQR